MDLRVQQVLRDARCEDFIKEFEDQQIDHESLLYLTDQMLSQLVPVFGPRARLLKEIKKLKDSSPPASSSNPSPSRSTSSAIRSRSPSPQESHHPEDSDRDSDVDDIVIDDDPVAWENLVNHPKPNAVVKALINRKSDARRILTNYPASKKNYRVRKGLKRSKDYVGLDLVHQKLLCDLIVKDACRDPDSIRCVTARVEQLAEEIVEVFPRERKSQYYIPFRCVKGTGGKVIRRFNAKGRLYNKFTNYLKVLREEYVTESRVRTDHISTPEISADVEASLQWLHKRVEICPRLKAEWDLTRDARISTLRTQLDKKSDNYMHVYIHTLYPCLCQPEGYLLLLSDFDALYPDKRNCLFMQWSTFASNLKKLANCSDSDLSDAEILYLLGDLFEEEGLTSLPVTRKYRAGKREMLSSFLMHVETVDDIDPHITAYETKAFQEKFTVQPYAIAVGPWPNPSQFYISYDGVLKRVDSVKDAIDLTFKIFHALHATYPRTSECYWMLLQKIIYEVDTPWDSASPEVESLISKLVQFR